MPIPAGPTTAAISIDEVKLRLKITVTTHDEKIQDFIDAAEAEYERWVGPLSGTVTETLDGGGPSLILRSPNVAAITSAMYADGSVIDVADLSLDTATGVVYWNYGTTGVFRSGARQVTITYTAGTLPADHREAILADVAGYFAATQRAGEARVDANGYADGFYTAPTTLFPRIRALALPGIA